MESFPKDIVYNYNSNSKYYEHQFLRYKNDLDWKYTVKNSLINQLG